MTAVLDETKAKVARALLKSAAGAAQQLESDVRQLVAMRAWEVLEYKDFSEMWEKECGFKIPTHVQVLAVAAVLHTESVQEGRGRRKDGSLRAVDVAHMVGLSTQRHPRTGALHSTTTSDVISQLRGGVPADEVTKCKRTRGMSRRLGKSPDELVLEGFMAPRRDADAINEIARKANLPKAEIYRQAVAEYLARYRESRP